MRAGLWFAFCASVALGHPGALDRNGGHWNKKNHTYHYHRGPEAIPYQRNQPRRSSRRTIRRTPPARTYQPRRHSPGSFKLKDGMTVYITRVVDGDTVRTRRFTIRLIGVDTPETKHPRKPVQRFGREATLYTRRTVERRLVNLQFGWQLLDKYRRVLAYIWFDARKKPDLNAMLNYRIIYDGYGHAYLRFPFKKEYMEAFRRAQREAGLAKRGLLSPLAGMEREPAMLRSRELAIED